MSLNTETHDTMPRLRRRLFYIPLLLLIAYLADKRRHSFESGDAYVSYKTFPRDNRIRASLYSEPNERRRYISAIDTDSAISRKRVPFKVYIYDIPSAYNDDVISCHNKVTCFDISNAGYGRVLYETHGVVFRDTYQGALEITLHYRLLNSDYVTSDPHEADVFYIPYYVRLLWMCSDHEADFKSSVPLAVFGNVSRMPYYAAGRPHIMTIGMPEVFIRTFRQPAIFSNITYLLIEAYDQLREQYTLEDAHYSPFIIAPYNGAGHLKEPNGGKYIRTLFDQKRPVFVFIAAGDRGDSSMITQFRHNIVKQFDISTNLSIVEYYNEQRMHIDDRLDRIRYVPWKCSAETNRNVLGWMTKSVFCVHPPGDSNCRKAFYDSLLCGCIPVIFELLYVKHVTYPFESVLDYSTFTVRVPLNDTLMGVLEQYRDDQEVLANLRSNLQLVMPYLQYNDPSSSLGFQADAFSLIMDEVGKHFGL